MKKLLLILLTISLVNTTCCIVSLPYSTSYYNALQLLDKYTDKTIQTQNSSKYPCFYIRNTNYIYFKNTTLKLSNNIINKLYPQPYQTASSITQLTIPQIKSLKRFIKQSLKTHNQNKQIKDLINNKKFQTFQAIRKLWSKPIFCRKHPYTL